MLEPMTQNLTQRRVVEAALTRLYNKAVRYRTNKSRVIPVPANLLSRVSKAVSDPAFSVLFIEAQFAAMPADWCLDKFKVPYPPANVVFSGECWRRYQEYIDSGERVPAWAVAK